MLVVNGCFRQLSFAPAGISMYVSQLLIDELFGPADFRIKRILPHLVLFSSLPVFGLYSRLQHPCKYPFLLPCFLLFCPFYSHGSKGIKGTGNLINCMRQDGQSLLKPSNLPLFYL